MTAIEWLYIHLLVISAAVLVSVWVRGQIHGVVAQVNARLTDINARDDSQRKINIWLADKCGEALAAARAKPDSKVLPFRAGGPGDGKRPDGGGQ